MPSPLTNGHAPPVDDDEGVSVAVLRAELNAMREALRSMEGAIVELRARALLTYERAIYALAILAGANIALSHFGG